MGAGSGGVIWFAALLLAQGPSHGSLDNDQPSCAESPAACAAAEAAADAADAGVAIRDDGCDEPQGQRQVDACAEHDLVAADARLNEQWEETVAEMKRLDRALPAGGDGQAGHYDTLVEAQRSWLAYRDAECRSESFLARGAPAQGSVEALCKTYLTELRVEQLRMLVTGLDF